ncbi:outer-membrane receptor for ferric coprogen and ferric-rhodotorulic acid [Puniceibacterium sediminis]|uniref:Outer-membrane receptor for ferric coprogen and ferric-rhodotorulic acid n=2 Tax=Puniceibacterium sediminis TaxID=1608407 RepID=A0A238X649_9RHOB|nr:outer-membrane receptor for ferric coprogen and ferric-rhodotorulic acid [Puniceibacterium sediminis]
MSQEVIEIEPILVEGSSYETEGTESYKTDLISVGEKSAVGPREVPQSITVITHRQIEDGGYTALEEALADAPGLLILNNDTGRSSIYSRGYEFDYLYFDGLPAPVSSIYGTQPDLSIVDHIEVLKGPAGLFIGTGEPAGSINMRLKQAKATTTEGYVSTSIDSNGRGRVEADVAGKLNADGTLRGRIVGAYADGDGFVDKQENGVKSVYGTLAWDITPDTLLTFSLSHMQRDIAPFNGLPAYADNSLIWIDASATTAADWNYFENATTDAVAAIEHHLANGGRLKFSMRNSQQDADFLYAFSQTAAAADNTVSQLSYLGRDFEQNSLALDAHAELPFSMGGWDANLIAGADWQRIDSKTLTYRARSAVGSWDLDDWDVSDVAKPDAAYQTKDETDATSTGLYTQLRLKPSAELTLIGGARLSWYDGTTKTTTLSSGASTKDELDVTARLTPFAGLTYDITPNATLYASYSEIFIPQSDVDKSGNLLDPIEGQQREIGIKAELGHGLNVSAALFDLREVNRSIAVPGESYFVAEEDVRSRGIELEVSGEVLDNLHMSGGYTYTETDYLNGSSEGETFSTVTPKNIFKLTATYEFTEGQMQGWSVGGRLTTMSGFSNRGVEAPGYDVVDLTVAKDLGYDTTLRVGVDNVFDADYYTRVGGPSVFNFRGAPRTINASLTKRF